MQAVEKFFAGAFALIAIYLVVVNSQGTSSVVSSLGSSLSNIFSTLQGNHGFGNMSSGLGGF
jgi:hypothetical protein